MEKKRLSIASIFDKVSDIIAQKNNVEKNGIELESNLTNDLGFDYLDTVEVSIDIEKEFGINLEKETVDSIELKNARTVEDLVNLIYRMVN